ncbi:MAG TPA: hypothetical protein GXX36_04375 [Clostridiaceae bacterium]|nr:hypothetical protein [Clostridiaceae bacterium]
MSYDLCCNLSFDLLFDFFKDVIYAEIDVVAVINAVDIVAVIAVIDVIDVF